MLNFLTAFGCAALRFRGNARGNVAVMFALSLLVIISAIGTAIDYGRAVNARTAMQAAVDATALMISKDAANLTPEQVTARAQAYFTALYTHPEVGSMTFNAEYTANSGSGASVTVNAAGAMPTEFMKVAGIPTVSLNVSSTTKWGNMRYRVALALDNTGSMASADKMNQLKLATKQLINEFYAMANTDGDVYISIVPFAKDVNIGSSFKAATWLRWSGANDSYDNTAGSCSSSSYTTKSSCLAAFRTWTATSQNSWNGCVMDRDQNYDTTIDIPDSAVQGTMVWPQQYSDCPTRMIGMTSVRASKQTLIDKVDAMSPDGSTNQGIGTFWAWMTHQTSGPFATPAKDANYTYIDAIVLLTDGMNTQSRYAGNGSSHAPAVDARQAILCSNARTNGLKIFAVQVATDGDPVQDVVKNCTSEPNNPNYFSRITQASQMTVQFQNIFKELAKLRLLL